MSLYVIYTYLVNAHYTYMSLCVIYTYLVKAHYTYMSLCVIYTYLVNAHYTYMSPYLVGDVYRHPDLCPDLESDAGPEQVLGPE